MNRSAPSTRRGQRAAAYVEWRDFNTEPSLAGVAASAVIGARPIRLKESPIGKKKIAAAARYGVRIDPAARTRLEVLFGRLEQADDTLDADPSKPYVAARDALGAIVEFLRSLPADLETNGRFSRALKLLHDNYLVAEIPPGYVIPGGKDVSGGIKRRAPQTALEMSAFAAMRKLMDNRPGKWTAAERVLSVLDEHGVAAIAVAGRDKVDRTLKQRAKSFARKFDRYMNGSAKSVAYVPDALRPNVPRDRNDEESIVGWLRDQLELAARGQ